LIHGDHAGSGSSYIEESKEEFHGNKEIRKKKKERK